MTDMPARELLSDLISFAEAANEGITPEEAVDAAIHEALLNQPVLRACLFPGCLRQYDATTHIQGKPPVQPAWSGEGWHKVTRGPATGDVCPTHVDVGTAHMARTIELPNGRYVAVCACGWETRPQVWGGMLRPLWEQHLLQTTGKLPTPEPADNDVERLPLSEHTDSTLRDLYDQLEDTEHARRETREAAQAMFKAWDWHRHTLGGAARAVTAVRNQMRTDSREWAATRGDAYLWAVLIGWDDDALKEVAARHRWDEHRIAYVKEMRGYLAPITDPQTQEA